MLLSRAPFFEEVLVQIKVFLLLNLTPEIAGRIITVYMEEFAANAVRLTTLGVAVLFVSALVTLLRGDTAGAFFLARAAFLAGVSWTMSTAGSSTGPVEAAGAAPPAS